MMAGFGKTAAAQEELNDAALPSHERKNPFAALEAEMSTMSDRIGHTFVGLVGNENTGKTAVVTSAYNKYVSEGGEKSLWALDFDGGAQANKSAFYPDMDSIVVWEPYVYMTNDRTAIDYPETHNRTMRLLQYAVHNSEKLWGVLITGLDGFDSVCINNMRIHDLGLSKDAISAADIRGAGADNRRVEFQWDWGLRKTRFLQLITLCRGLVKKGVRVFLETHLAQTNDNDERSLRPMSGTRPAWEKSTAGLVFQIILFEREDVRDENGNLTNQRFTATYEKSKTDAGLQGQRRIILTTEAGGKPVWYGLQELEEGRL